MFRFKLKELREERQLSQKELSEIIGKSRGTVGNWEAGIREPDLATVKMIADYFGVSVDKLLGHSPFSKEQISMIRDNLYQIYLAVDMTDARDSGFPIKLIEDILEKKDPTYEDIFKIADAYGCSVEEILYRKSDSENKIKPATPEGDGLTAKKRALIAKIERLSDDDIDVVSATADAIIARREK